jgi:hypothetical protein
MGLCVGRDGPPPTAPRDYYRGSSFSPAATKGSPDSIPLLAHFLQIACIACISVADLVCWAAVVRRDVVAFLSPPTQEHHIIMRTLLFCLSAACILVMGSEIITTLSSAWWHRCTIDFLSLVLSLDGAIVIGIFLCLAALATITKPRSIQQ